MGDQTVSVQMNLQGKNILVAYLLWWFLGWLGIHRFYLGRTKTGLAQLFLFIIGVLTLILIIGYFLLIAWIIWWLLDAYFTYKIVEEENQKLGVENSTLSLSKSGEINIGNELDQLEKLHSLFEKGIITEEQYEEKKAKLI